MKRKATRFPGIFRLPDGRLYVRTSAVNPKTGKRNYGTRTLDRGRTMEEAKQVLLAVQADLRSSAGVKTMAKSICMNDYAELWDRWESIDPVDMLGP